VKYQVARDGKVLGEWTGTELYPLLRDNIVSPRDYYWTEGMGDWAHVAELPLGKRHLASKAQQDMLTRNGIPFDELTSKAEVSCLMDAMLRSRPASEKQRAFIAEHGLSCPDTASVKDASEIVERIINRQHSRTGQTAGPLDVVLEIVVDTDNLP
jgi:hypothetical protein